MGGIHYVFGLIHIETVNKVPIEMGTLELCNLKTIKIILMSIY